MLLDFSTDGNVSLSTAEMTAVPPTSMSSFIYLCRFNIYKVPKVERSIFYDPHLNKDFGGEYFNFIHNKLVQLDVVNTDKTLIPPWEFYNTLKPETLVLICASLYCYIMRDKRAMRKVC